MPSDVQPVLVYAVLLGMQPQPAARAQHLAHDLLHRHLRAEVVVHHRERDAGVDPGWGQEREVPLVERAPVAAVDEHHAGAVALRSEEHTSELQSQSNLVCRLLLEKKKNTLTNVLKHSSIDSE